MPVLLLGDPCLREVSEPVTDLSDASFQRDAAALKAALNQFRQEHGFGRAIAAPQIGIKRRMIAYNLGSGTSVMINPTILEVSEEKFTLWDDCMSFPWLMVKVRRHCQIKLEFMDESGEIRQWNDINQSTSELLQHEIDHLNGVLAVDLACDRDSLVAREVYQSQRAYFDGLVDYSIPPLSHTRD